MGNLPVHKLKEYYDLGIVSGLCVQKKYTPEGKYRIIFELDGQSGFGYACNRFNSDEIKSYKTMTAVFNDLERITEEINFFSVIEPTQPLVDIFEEFALTQEK